MPNAGIRRGGFLPPLMLLLHFLNLDNINNVLIFINYNALRSADAGVQSCILLTKTALVLKALFFISLFNPLLNALTTVVKYISKEVLPMVFNALKLVTAEFIDTFKAFCINAVAGLALLT